MESQRVETLPETGKCVLAHPNRERQAAVAAAAYDAPYYLRAFVPDEPAVFLVDLDYCREFGSGAYNWLVPEIPAFVKNEMLPWCSS